MRIQVLRIVNQFHVWVEFTCRPIVKGVELPTSPTDIRGDCFPDTRAYLQAGFVSALQFALKGAQPYTCASICISSNIAGSGVFVWSQVSLNAVL